MVYIFEDYELDLRRYELRYAGKLVKLEPQVFDVLVYLIQHCDRVVTKEELLEHVWPGRIVSETTLTSRLMAARRATGDRGREQRVIQTLHGRGYRFVAPVEEHPDDVPAPRETTPAPHIDVLIKRQVRAATPEYLSPQPSPGPGERRQEAAVGISQEAALPSTFTPSAVSRAVGREAELAQLHRWLQQALEGTRQVIFVTGETGLGKTTLVEAFLNDIEAYGGLWVGRGQCLEHYGAGEAYMPILDALGRLCREPGGRELLAFLMRRAPTWMVQMPWLIDDAMLDLLQPRVMGATRERMLREMAEAVEVLTAERPLVLVLEDLHWSDASTLDLIVSLARRREPARLLLLGTYRPAEVMRRGHPLQTVKHDLLVRGQCRELPLQLLSEAQVAGYLARRFPGTTFPVEMTRFLHQRTDGNPLFMVNVVDYWQAQGLSVATHHPSTLLEWFTALTRDVPETLRQLVEQQLEQLSGEDQELLAAASVAGKEFAAAVVAAGVDREIEEGEALLDLLARRGQFLRPHGITEWPDGTVSTCYAFIHDLYREVLYDQVPVSRRVRWHQRIGARLEMGYGSQARDMAAELAMHFVRGRDALRAVHYLQYAGEQALQRNAHQEAVAYLTEGLGTLATLPASLEHRRHELTLRLALGNVLVAMKGFRPEVQDVYMRAWELSQEVGDTAQLFPALRGVWAISFQRGKLQEARTQGEQFLRLSQSQQDPALLLEAHRILGCTLLTMGEFSRAREHVERGVALYNFQRHRTHAFLYAQDPGMSCLIYAAWILWCLGYPDQALQKTQEALTLASELAHPFSLAWAHSFAATVSQLRREVQSTREQAATSMAICREQGFMFRLARSTILQGWAMTMQGRGEEGLRLMTEGLAAHRETGLELGLPYLQALLAEGYAREGHVDEGLSVLAEALSTLQAMGEGWWEAEIYRLQGELLLTLSNAPYLEAEDRFQQALIIARRQQAKSWELRVATSLSRLWQRQSKHREARELLAAVYGWFTEGFDTADLREARALLQGLGG